MFKNAKVLTKAEEAPKDSDALEKAITASPNKTIAPKLENRIVKLGAAGGKAKASCP
jgi:hypothetical protein